MKKYFFLLFCSLILQASLFAQGILTPESEIKIPVTYTPQNKVSSQLHLLMKDQTILATVNDKMRSSGQIMLHENIPARLINNKLQVGLLIKATDISAVEHQIIAAGGIIETIAGDIVVAEVPLDSAAAIAHSDAALYSDISVARKPLLNNSRTAIKADIVQTGTGLPQSYTGKGVVMGIVDSGIDWSYADFSNNSGTRIKYLWDMSGSANPPTGYSYGTEYTKSQIDAKACAEHDLADGEGHGTHVTCIAAGNGSTNSLYIGIATASDIVFVKGFKSSANFSDNDVINGCSYIFSKAQSLGEPAVVNLSLGGHFGPHDGTSNYEQALSNLTGNGKIICASAGNEGSDVIHLSYTASGTSTATASVTQVIPDAGATAVLIDMWYPQTSSLSVGLAVYSTAGSLLGYTTPIAPGGSTNSTPITIGGTTYGVLTVDATTVNDPNNNCREAIVYLTNNNGTYNLSNVNWYLYTYGSGTFDAWLATGGSFATTASGNNKAGNNISSVAIPGTAKKVICVGSYVTTPCWPSITKYTYCYNPAATKDSLSLFSSHGPSRDGRIKPDLVAPGQAIISALSSSLIIGTDVDSAWITADAKHQIMQGTSMASPHVAGVIAMLLERNKSLNYDQVYSIITSSTTKDSYTGQTANQLFGYGKLNALNAVKATTTDVSQTPSKNLVYRLYHNYPNPFNPTTKIAYEIPAPAVVSLRIYDILGNEVGVVVNEMKQAGYHEAEFDGTKLASGVYVCQLRAGGQIFSQKMMLLK
jgi:subtilisin family serine protease